VDLQQDTINRALEIWFDGRDVAVSHLLLTPDPDSDTMYLVGYAHDTGEDYAESEGFDGTNNVRFVIWPARLVDGELHFASDLDAHEATKDLEFATHTHEGTASPGDWTLDSLTTLAGTDETTLREISQVVLLALRHALEMVKG